MHIKWSFAALFIARLMIFKQYFKKLDGIYWKHSIERWNEVERNKMDHKRTEVYRTLKNEENNKNQS